MVSPGEGLLRQWVTLTVHGEDRWQGLPERTKREIHASNLIQSARERWLQLVMYRVRECPCGTVERMHVRAKRCEECRRNAGPKRTGNPRGHVAGRRRPGVNWRSACSAWLTVAGFSSALSKSIPCQHCGEPFRPKRCTARFCSAKCRFAWHRGNVR